MARKKDRKIELQCKFNESLKDQEGRSLPLSKWREELDCSGKGIKCSKCVMLQVFIQGEDFSCWGDIKKNQQKNRRI